MPLFPAASIAPYANYPDRLATIATKTPVLLHEAFLPPLLLFLTLLLYPRKSPLRNALALPVIVGLYARLVRLYTSSHWGFAFCVGAYAYYGALQAFNLLVVKDVARDADVRWQIDDTGVASSSNGHAHSNGNGEVKKSNGSTNGTTNGNASRHMNGNGVANGGSHGISNGTAGGQTFRASGLGYPEISKYPLIQRIRFTGSLIFASRGVGWKFQIRHIPEPPSPGTSLLSFIRTHAAKILFTYTVLETFSYIAAIDPYFTTPACWTTPFHRTALPADEYHALCMPSSMPATPAAVPFLWHNIFRKYMGLFSVYAILTQLFSIAALLLTVLIPVTRPEGWSPLFGSLADATSLRGFWTKFWHGIFKKYFSYPGEWIAFQLLQLDRRSARAQMIVMLAAFVNSGALHGVGCYTLNGRWRAAAGFFLLQPLGFVGEIAVYKMLKMCGVDARGTVGKVVTTVYSMTWLLWSSEVFAYDFLYGGISVAEPVAWSFWRWWTGTGGQAWRWGRPGEWLRWDTHEGSLGGWGVRL
ncbi:hypothetical protein TWF696_008545 [Orbilia brochopaga]|uniref:Wax synthase domain-containing protein n=1 Tax=Orbilia brochopaga TaxID=3140254 RepID=A0AAV9UI98_9PEZI